MQVSSVSKLPSKNIDSKLQKENRKKELYMQ